MQRVYVVLSQTLNVRGKLLKQGSLFATVELADGVTIDQLQRAINFGTYRFTTDKPDTVYLDDEDQGKTPPGEELRDEPVMVPDEDLSLRSSSEAEPKKRERRSRSRSRK